MSLKQRLRISIIGLVLTIVLGASVLGVHSLLDDAFRLYELRAHLAADQVYAYVQGRFAVDETVTAQVSPSLLRRDQVLQRVLRRTVDPLVTGLALEEATGTLIASAGNWSGTIAPWPSKLWQKARMVLWGDADALMVRTLPGGSDLMLRTRLSTAEMRALLLPPLTQLLIVSFGALIITSTLAILLSNVVSRSIERLTSDVERLSHAESTDSEPFFESKELADLQQKLRQLAHQYHGAKTHAAHLRLDIDQMLQRLEEVILVFDASGRLQVAGTPAERLLLKPREDLLQKPIDEVLPGWTDLGPIVTRALKTGTPVSDSAVTFARPNLRPVKLLATVEPMKDGAGGPRGCLVTLRDAELRRALESQIDIASRLAAINRLTSGVAHEMKNPLNGIALNLEVLKAQLPSDFTKDGPLQAIEREAARLDKVVKSFLEFSRPIEPSLHEHDLGCIVQNAISTTTAAATSRDIEIRFGTECNEAPVMADAELCLRAIQNVLQNALEAMSKPGQVQVNVRRVFDDFILTIRDEGEGIAPEHHDKVYNLYFTTKPESAGIGLALTFLVVQLHNGAIDFDSTPGAGTEFRLRFPAAKSASA